MITLNDLVSNPPSYLGTSKYFNDLFSALSFHDDWTQSELRSYLSNNMYSGYPYINRGVNLLEYVDLIEEVDGKLRSRLDINKSEYEKIDSRIISELLSKIRADSLFTEVFPDGSVSYDAFSEELTLNPIYRPAKYSPIWTLIIDLYYPSYDIASKQPIKIKNNGLLSQFRNSTADRAYLTLEQLKNKLAAQEKAGREAELFVLNYEKQRLENHRSVSKIMMISDFNVGAGYDLVSYNDTSSLTLDRYIEVKSFSGPKPQFYWSENEIETARVKQASYYLYLVDRQNMHKTGYKPAIICNPYAEVLNSKEWSQYPSVLRLSKN